METLIGWESILERDAICLVEYDPEVVAYEEQPSEETYYTPDGMSRRYFPDLRLNYRGGKIVDVEIKPARKLQDFFLAEKYVLIQKRYAQLGRHFRLWTDDEIRAEPHFSQIKALHRARRRLRKAA
jgi:hypothetical protein